MGITICSKHGRQGFREMCEHVDAEFTQGNYKQFRSLVFWLDMLVCDRCWEKYNLERYENHPDIVGNFFYEIEEDSPITKDYENIYNEMQRRIWCWQCIAEVQVSTARKNKEPDPFPVYEKTLNENQQDVINEFYKFLTTHFQFQQSTTQHFLTLKDLFLRNPLAVYIRAGAYTYPLTLTIYYVVSEIEQEKIIQIVNEFFHNKELNQVKLEFYEAEIWDTISGINTEASGVRKGNEKLCNEVYLNCYQQGNG